MRQMSELVACYEQGIYTFGEAVTAILCEAATRDPKVLAGELPRQFLDAVEDWISALPDSATSDDVVVLKSSREHAVILFNGAVAWRGFFRTARGKRPV